MSSTNFDMAASRALLEQVVRDATSNLPKVYSVFEYDEQTGSYSRTTHPEIINLISSEPFKTAKAAQQVSAKSLRVYAVIALRAIQTAPNTIVYDGTDEIYAIVVGNTIYRKA